MFSVHWVQNRQYVYRIKSSQNVKVDLRFILLSKSFFLVPVGGVIRQVFLSPWAFSFCSTLKFRHTYLVQLYCILIFDREHFVISLSLYIHIYLFIFAFVCFLCIEDEWEEETTLKRLFCNSLESTHLRACFLHFFLIIFACYSVFCCCCCSTPWTRLQFANFSLFCFCLFFAS